MNLQLEANQKIILHFFASDRKTGPSKKHCIDTEQKVILFCQPSMTLMLSKLDKDI